MRPHSLTIVVVVAALVGLGFAAFSTYDSIAHLDRQVHGIHCSFLPGLESPDLTGSSGCHVTLMSPYSSVFRDAIWGGVPIALPAMSVFAFLAFWAVVLVVRRRQDEPRATAFLALATALPLITSIGMAYVSLAELDVLCKVCLGIYGSSTVAFLAALSLFWRARRRAAVPGDRPEGRPVPLRMLDLVGAFGLGVLFVAVPVVTYALGGPDFERYVGTCGTLQAPVAEDLAVPLGPQSGSIDVVEVFDPLCPACRGFERRFDALVSGTRVKRRLMLFPLDDECNWMVDRALHPGACTVSEAILCAGGRAEEVIEWAFDEQENIRRAAKDDPEAAKRLVSQRFPALSECVGSPAVQARLNLALRWAVANQLPVLTPQVYVGGRRMCDADTDLGMDWAHARLLARAEREGPVVVRRRPDEVPEWRRRERSVERPARIRKAVRRGEPAVAEPEPAEAEPVEPEPEAEGEGGPEAGGEIEAEGGLEAEGAAAAPEGADTVEGEDTGGGEAGEPAGTAAPAPPRPPPAPRPPPEPAGTLEGGE